MKPSITRTAPRITDKSAAFYRQAFGSVNAGMEFAGDAFPQLYRQTLETLKGRFSPSELSAVISAYDGVETIQADTAGELLKVRVERYLIDAAKKIDVETFIQKIADLRPFEKSALELWARSMHNQIPAESSVAQT